MGKTYIYSYRLVYFGGTAPCYDDNLLTLSICKVDMRRVIGSLWNNPDFDKNKDSIYFIGIVGSALARSKNFKGRKGKTCYIAKVTDVSTFGNYFSTEKERKCVFRLNGTACTLQREGCPLQTGSFNC